MKTRKLLFLILILSASCFLSCKKDSSNPKTDASLFNNTVWVGEFNYTGKGDQPVSIQFGTGGSVNWHELSKDVPGTYTLTNVQLNVALSNGSSFSATVQGKALANIENAAANGFGLNSLALSEVPEINLDNTVWTGTNIKLTFKPGNKADLSLGAGVNYYFLPYVKNGKSIRFAASVSYTWFMIISAENQIKGINMVSPDPTIYSYNLTKN